MDEAFRPRNIQESIAANVEPQQLVERCFQGSLEEWNARLSYVPQTQKSSVGSFAKQEYNVASPPNYSMPSSQYGSQALHAYYRQPSRNDSEIMSMETRSDYCLSTTNCNYNPHPRGWRRQTEVSRTGRMPPRFFYFLCFFAVFSTFLIV